jgi:hypothetical protein
LIAHAADLSGACVQARYPRPAGLSGLRPAAPARLFAARATNGLRLRPTTLSRLRLAPPPAYTEKSLFHNRPGLRYGF